MYPKKYDVFDCVHCVCPFLWLSPKNEIEDAPHHLLTVFYFNFLSSLKVNKVLAALQVEVENFILRMAAEFPIAKRTAYFSDKQLRYDVSCVDGRWLCDFEFL